MFRSSVSMLALCVLRTHTNSCDFGLYNIDVLYVYIYRYESSSCVFQDKVEIFLSFLYSTSDRFLWKPTLETVETESVFPSFQFSTESFKSKSRPYALSRSPCIARVVHARCALGPVPTPLWRV